MHISDFVEQNLDPVLDEWVEFARSRQPTAHRLSHKELADHARVLLGAIAADIRTPQGEEAGREKAEGNAPENAPDITRTAREHAELRFAQGFLTDDLLSEFRALRASVVRRWTEALEDPGRESLDELSRFGEAMDQALFTSVNLYSTKVDDARKLLLGVLGHDLRTPLGVVSMTSEQLLRSGCLDAQQSNSVARIHRSANRIQTMVDDILDFTRTALGVRMPVVPIAANMGDIARTISEEVGAAYPRATVHLACEGPLEGTWDIGRIGQLLSNLTSNAIQHGDHGKAVLIKVAGEKDAVAVSIHNEGPAIPAETQSTLFTPLRQAWSAEAETHAGSSGLGLGLYIAREIALAHGGSIDFSSDARGTTFRARLPRTPPASPQVKLPPG